MEIIVERELLPAYDAGVADLEALEPPEDQADVYAEYIDNLEVGRELLADDPVGVLTEGSAASDEFAEFSATSTELEAELGVCGDTGTAPEEATGTTGEQGA